MESNWPKYTLTAIAAALAGVVATHSSLGVRVTTVEVEVKTMCRQLDRMEAMLEKEAGRKAPGPAPGR